MESPYRRLSLNFTDGLHVLNHITDLLSVCTELIDRNYESGAKVRYELSFFLKKNSKNLEIAIQEFIKGAEKDIKKRNFDKKIATTCAEKVWSSISPF